jgi:metal-responsive CopG/Arc/MetJ family transcriptional regulator
MRKKIADDKKKQKFAVTVDEKLLKIFETYLEESDISNRSKYIERLIEADMKERGEDVKKEF